jgi:hypothetical protein
MYHSLILLPKSLEFPKFFPRAARFEIRSFLQPLGKYTNRNSKKKRNKEVFFELIHLDAIFYRFDRSSHPVYP